jgi:benzoylformate decarboxylase
MDIAAAIPTDAVVVEEALSSSFKLLDYVPLRDHQSYYGLASGGIGFATAGAIGISLALPNRPIVALIGDGSSMYSIQALWTAAHLKRPITYIIANNRGYKILKQRLRSFRKAENYVGMEIDAPAIDFVRMGESMGLTSTRVQDPKELKDAIERGIKSNAPNLIEVEISADLDT